MPKHEASYYHRKQTHESHRRDSGDDMAPESRQAYVSSSKGVYYNHSNNGQRQVGDEGNNGAVRQPRYDNHRSHFDVQESVRRHKVVIGSDYSRYEDEEELHYKFEAEESSYLDQAHSDEDEPQWESGDVARSFFGHYRYERYTHREEGAASGRRDGGKLAAEPQAAYDKRSSGIADSAPVNYYDRYRLEKEQEQEVRRTERHYKDKQQYRTERHVSKKSSHRERHSQGSHRSEKQRHSEEEAFHYSRGSSAGRQLKQEFSRESSSSSSHHATPGASGGGGGRMRDGGLRLPNPSHRNGGGRVDEEDDDGASAVAPRRGDPPRSPRGGSSSSSSSSSSARREEGAGGRSLRWDFDPKTGYTLPRDMMEWFGLAKDEGAAKDGGRRRHREWEGR